MTTSSPASKNHSSISNLTDNQENNIEKPSTDSSEEGFGEDLGAALQISQKAIPSKKDSKFSALINAADEFKDAYNRNSKL